MLSIPSDTNKSSLHVGESILYQIHKNALTQYLQQGEIDQRIISMNLLKISSLKIEELMVLKKALQQQSTNRTIQDEANKILKKFKPKRRQSQFGYFMHRDNSSQEEQDLQQLEDQLYASFDYYLSKLLLKSKLNTCKLFNGSYLVDPTIEDLRKQDQKGKLPKVELTQSSEGVSSSRIRNLRRQASILKMPQIKQPQNSSPLKTCNQEEVQQIVSNYGNESQDILVKLREKYKESEQTQEQRRFFMLVKNGDSVNLNQQLINGELPIEIINTSNEKGFYAVHLAVMQGDSQMLKLLLKFGANPYVLTKMGKNIKQLNQIYFNEEIYQVIRSLTQK